MNSTTPNTIDDLIDFYVKSPQFTISIRRDATRRQYEYLLRRLSDITHDGKRVGEFQLNELKVSTCQVLYYKMIEEAQGEGVRNANYIVQVAVRAWNVLIKHDFLTGNPWSLVERMQVAPRRTVWTREDFERILEVAFSESRWRNIGLLVRINAELGQRAGDMRLVQWINFDFEQQLYVRKSIEKTREHIPGIPFSDNLKRMLLDQREYYGSQEWVVPNPHTMKPYEEANLRQVFRELARAAGVPDELQFRDIRRTVLTDLANHGATDNELMSFSGHKSRNSLTPYTRISVEQARNAAAKRNFQLDDKEEVWKRKHQPTT
jgi:integrase